MCQLEVPSQSINTNEIWHWICNTYSNIIVNWMKSHTIIYEGGVSPGLPKFLLITLQWWMCFTFLLWHLQFVLVFRDFCISRNLAHGRGGRQRKSSQSMGFIRATDVREYWLKMGPNLEIEYKRIAPTAQTGSETGHRGTDMVKGARQWFF